jgi:ABC-type multidrug transport system fused ATPase/permease subunit
MSFFSQKRVGELNSRISNDITQIQDTLNYYCRVLASVYLDYGSFIMLASINIKLTIMMVSVVPLVGVAAVLLVGIRKYSKKVQDQVAESQVVVEETMQGIKHS